MAAAPPPLFDRVPGGLFSPLSGQLAPLCWELLTRFYMHEFEGEPMPLDKSAALLHAELLLRDSILWRERRVELLAEAADEDAAVHQDLLDESAALREGARRLLQRLEKSGWFHFEYRSGQGFVLHFFPYSARLLETLLRIARDEQPVFQGYAHSIASLLRRESYTHRPGVALLEAKRHTLDLTRELKILSQNIHGFIQRLFIAASSAQQVLSESIDHYKSAVLANYHRLKTVDNLYKWRDEILARLDTILCEETTLGAAARFYAEQFSLDAEAARATVISDLRLLRTQFDALPSITEEIDARNARFSGVALRKLTYLLRQDRRIETQLQLLTDRLASDDCPALDFDIYRCELLGEDFLYMPPKRKAVSQPQPLPVRPAVDEAALRKKVLPRLANPFSRNRIEQFVQTMLSKHWAVPTTDIELSEDADYVRMIYVVAYGLDSKSAYRFIPECDDTVSTSSLVLHDERGRYRVPKGTLIRASKRR